MNTERWILMTELEKDEYINGGNVKQEREKTCQEEKQEKSFANERRQKIEAKNYDGKSENSMKRNEKKLMEKKSRSKR